MHIHKIVQRFEQTGSVRDKRHTNTGRLKAVRSSESIEQVRKVVAETAHTFVRTVLGNTANIGLE
jgi:hypothetical protein